MDNLIEKSVAYLGDLFKLRYYTDHAIITTPLLYSDNDCVEIVVKRETPGHYCIGDDGCGIINRVYIYEQFDEVVKERIKEFIISNKMQLSSQRHHLEIWKHCIYIDTSPESLATIIIEIAQVSAIIEHLVWWEGQKVNE